MLMFYWGLPGRVSLKAALSSIISVHEPHESRQESQLTPLDGNAIEVYTGKPEVVTERLR